MFNDIFPDYKPVDCDALNEKVSRYDVKKIAAILCLAAIEDGMANKDMVKLHKDCETVALKGAIMVKERNTTVLDIAEAYKDLREFCECAYIMGSLDALSNY